MYGVAASFFIRPAFPSRIAFVISVSVSRAAAGRHHRNDPLLERAGRTELRADRTLGGPLEGALKTKRAVQIADMAAMDSYRQRHPRAVDAVELGRIRTVVAVPKLECEVAGLRGRIDQLEELNKRLTLDGKPNSADD